MLPYLLPHAPPAALQVSTETRIIGLKEDKERLLLDVTEAEKQILLLDKKIALERETQAALDPEVGAAEARAMQREIHRMRLRYAQLQRRQEIMINDMERAIYKCRAMLNAAS